MAPCSQPVSTSAIANCAACPDTRFTSDRSTNATASAAEYGDGTVVQRWISGSWHVS
jgi:hypothetical protein